MGIFQTLVSKQNAPTAAPTGGGGVFSNIVAKAQQPQVTTSGIDISPTNVAKARGGLAAVPTALRDLAQGAAKGATQGVIQGVSGLTTLGGGIEKVLDNTVGRMGNVLSGNGNVPTTTSSSPLRTGSELNKSAELPVLQPKNTTEKVGSVLGQGADLLVAPPGGKIASRGAELGVSTGEKVAGKVGQIATEAASSRAASTAAKESDSVIEMVSPKLTPKQTADALATRGGTKSGVLGTVKLNADPKAKVLADIVKQYVPEFNSNKSLVENINTVKRTVGTMANDLKTKVVASGKDIIYPFKELASKMDAVEKPISLKADATLSRQFDLAKEAALKIVKDSGGKVSNLFDARKSFDALVEKEFPTLYDRENAPMRAAITSMRRVMNDFIESKLPNGSGFKDSLRAQSKLLDVIENMSDKAASQVGTNVIERGINAVRSHPILGGLGAMAAYSEAKKLPVIGSLLP